MNASSHATTIAVVVDATNLNCPLPVLKAKKALATIVTGECLKLTATDRDSIRDLQAFAKKFGHQFVGHTETQGVLEFVIQKG